MRFLIINPFKNNFEPNGGTEIRIKGYTGSIISAGYNFYFMSPVKPEYIPEHNYVNFSLPRYFNKVILIHNYLYRIPILSILSNLLNYRIRKNRNLRILVNLSVDSINVVHKEQNVLLYLLLRNNSNFIYDIHGILNLQKEYSEQLSFIKKYWFKLNLQNEKRLYKILKYANVLNQETLSFLRSEFSYSGSGFIAPDGLLVNPEMYSPDSVSVKMIKEKFQINNPQKIILFIGAFKKFGGVQFLTDAFVKLAKQDPDLILFLIGTGQMEQSVFNTIHKNNLDLQLIHLKEINYSQIINYQEIADVIVIPDIAGAYNELTPHIKLYDALVSGKNLVVPDFKVNRDIVSSLAQKEFTYFFKPSSQESLQETLLFALAQTQRKRVLPELPESITYNNKGLELLKQYKNAFAGNRKEAIYDFHKSIF